MNEYNFTIICQKTGQPKIKKKILKGKFLTQTTKTDSRRNTKSEL